MEPRTAPALVANDVVVTVGYDGGKHAAEARECLPSPKDLDASLAPGAAGAPGAACSAEEGALLGALDNFLAASGHKHARGSVIFIAFNNGCSANMARAYASQRITQDHATCMMLILTVFLLLAVVFFNNDFDFNYKAMY